MKISRILTLGLFTLLINAALLAFSAWIADLFGLNVEVDGFWAAFLGALLISFVSVVLSLALNPIQRKLIDRFHKVVLQKIEELKPTSFLDAGCGEGFVAGLITEQVPDVQLTGFDFNPSSVELARKLTPTCNFTVASIFEIPFGPQEFDVTGCFEVLEHQTDPAGALDG